MKYVPLLLLLSAVTACGPQTSNQVVLATDDGTKRLIYDCPNFRPQVESAEQLQVLGAAYGQTVRHASEHQHFVTAQALMDAYKAGDWRRVEQLIVEYRCASRAKFPP
jgi:hypothetical protein